jgi:nucleotide-binding universal stress UspA family protein
MAEKACEDLLASDFNAEPMMLEGMPGAEIVRAVEDANFDLAVVGGGREGWLGNLLLGSVSTHVLHSSPTSVLVVHKRPSQGDTAKIVLGIDGSTGSSLATRTLIDLAHPAHCAVVVVSVVIFRPRTT